MTGAALVLNDLTGGWTVENDTLNAATVQFAGEVYCPCNGDYVAIDPYYIG